MATKSVLPITGKFLYLTKNGLLEHILFLPKTGVANKALVLALVLLRTVFFLLPVLLTLIFLRFVATAIHIMKREARKTTTGELAYDLFRSANLLSLFQSNISSVFLHQPFAFSPQRG